MSFDLDRIKRIDNRQKWTVFGYLRETFDDNLIDLICYICLSFYASLQTFSKCSQYLELSGDDNNTLKGIDGHTSWIWCSAFGETWIESTSTHFIEWQIKLNNDGEFSDGYFGAGIISNHHEQNPDKDCESEHSYMNYFYNNGSTEGIFKIDGRYNEKHDAIDKLHRKIFSGDTIHFILNMRDTKLYYYLNDEISNKRILTKSIKTAKDMKYSFAITMNPLYITCSITVKQKWMNFECL